MTAYLRAPEENQLAVSSVPLNQQHLLIKAVPDTVDSVFMLMVIYIFRYIFYVLFGKDLNC